jgi:chemotaxis protein methyltransferase CheR
MIQRIEHRAENHLNAEFGMRDTGCRIQDAKYRIQDAGFRIQEAGSSDFVLKKGEEQIIGEQKGKIMPNVESQKIELELLLEAIYQKYGYDFRDYARSSIKRRVARGLSLSGLKTISDMQHKLLYDKKYFETVLLNLSINVTEMFRDPSFYKALRKKVISELKDRPFIKVWHAGCATGEEVYSMAILLKEEGIYEKARIYATDFNEKVIKQAKEGIFPIEMLKKYTHNYQQAGGHESFADYYTAQYEYVAMKKALKKNITFADHNLVTDSTFGEMDLIVCRNVLIYFNRKLQNSVFDLFQDSLREGGVLCLGSKESIRFSDCSDGFEDVVRKEKIYRKK